jgi:hypothetical protein
MYTPMFVQHHVCVRRFLNVLCGKAGGEVSGAVFVNGTRMMLVGALLCCAQQTYLYAHACSCY